MTLKRHFELFSLVAIGLSACGSEVAPALDDSPQVVTDCVTLPTNLMNPPDVFCALAAEFQTVTDVMKTITDRKTANTAIRKFKKSGARIAALKVKLNTFSKAEEAQFTAQSKPHTTALQAATKEFVVEWFRVRKEHPELVRQLSPAVKGVVIRD